jgi:hypothetical protein
VAHPLIVSVWVPGALQNPKNWHAWGLWKHRRYVKTWRERTGQYLLQALCRFEGRRWPWPTAAPKRITFTISTGREWDDDGVVMGLAGVRDALRDMQLIVDDAPRYGNEFVYAQQRKAERGSGVEISIALKDSSI